jgi:hypothetical protein
MNGDPWSLEDYLALIHRPPSVAVPDGILRYTCQSRKTPGKKYVVELDSYNGNGACSCRDFQFNLEKYLKKGMSGREVFEKEFITELRPFQFSPDEALMCFHICEARREFANAIIQGVMRMEKKREEELEHARKQLPKAFQAA